MILGKIIWLIQNLISCLWLISVHVLFYVASESLFSLLGSPVGCPGGDSIHKYIRRFHIYIHTEIHTYIQRLLTFIHAYMNTCMHLMIMTNLIHACGHYD